MCRCLLSLRNCKDNDKKEHYAVEIMDWAINIGQENEICCLINQGVGNICCQETQDYNYYSGTAGHVAKHYR